MGVESEQETHGPSAKIQRTKEIEDGKGSNVQ
jgi:hypothetical protein